MKKRITDSKAPPHNTKTAKHSSQPKKSESAKKSNSRKQTTTAPVSKDGGKRETKTKDNKIKPWQHSSQKKALTGKLLSSDKHRYWGMTLEQIWESEPGYQEYELRKFKNNVARLKKTVKCQMKQTEFDNLHVPIHKKDFPRAKLTNRGHAFWDTCKAKEYLEYDVAYELEKKKVYDSEKKYEDPDYKLIKPSKLRKTRPDYELLDVTTFCKRFHEEVKKQRGQTFWVEKRNKKSMKKHLKEKKKQREMHRL